MPVLCIKNVFILFSKARSTVFSSGKLLGYLVSQRGIEANPKKVKAIEDMQSPCSHKEV